MKKIKNFIFRIYKKLNYKKIVKEHKKNKTELCSHEIRLMQFHKSLLDSERFKDDLKLNKFGYKNFSQFDEDGIINEIFKRIGTKTKCFLEIGVGDGLECNTHSLIYNDWSGSWIDGSEHFCKQIRSKFKFALDNNLNLSNSFVNKDNINELANNLCPNGIDLLSIDIDGNDFYIWDSIVDLNPRVVIMEYNTKFPPPMDWVMEYNESHMQDKTSYFGASLVALTNLGTKKQYSLVGCSLHGANAFFVRNDLLDDKFQAPYTAENHYEPCRYSLAWKYRSGLKDGVGPFTSSLKILKK